MRIGNWWQWPHNNSWPWLTIVTDGRNGNVKLEPLSDCWKLSILRVRACNWLLSLYENWLALITLYTLRLVFVLFSVRQSIQSAPNIRLSRAAPILDSITKWELLCNLRATVTVVVDLLGQIDTNLSRLRRSSAWSIDSALCYCNHVDILQCITVWSIGCHRLFCDQSAFVGPFYSVE